MNVFMSSALPEDLVLDFGKYRGRRLGDVPFWYLRFLSLWRWREGHLVDIMQEYIESQTQEYNFSGGMSRLDATGARALQDLYNFARAGEIHHACKVIRLHQKLLAGAVRVSDFIASRLFVRTDKSDYMDAARAILMHRRLCMECGGPLVAIGSARENGAPHDDWEGRVLHKKCWISLNRGFE
jgi:uncharacterized protein (DUF3820 family)